MCSRNDILITYSFDSNTFLKVSLDMTEGNCNWDSG